MGDLNLAFELINHRYGNRNLITIISCEHFIDDLMSFDEAIASRIYQRSKGFASPIERKLERNYRMRGI